MLVSSSKALRRISCELRSISQDECAQRATTCEWYNVQNSSYMVVVYSVACNHVCTWYKYLYKWYSVAL